MQAILETDEQIKIRKKGMGSKHHSLLQLAIITQMVVKYNDSYKAVPELSLDINGKERIPDLAIYKSDDISFGIEEVRMKNMPLAVVEILSPTQALTDLVSKSDDYFEAGIASYWIVLPEVKSIYVYSDIQTFKVFTFQDVLNDSQLDIELDLNKVF